MELIKNKTIKNTLLCCACFLGCSINACMASNFILESVDSISKKSYEYSDAYTPLTVAAHTYDAEYSGVEFYTTINQPDINNEAVVKNILGVANVGPQFEFSIQKLESAMFKDQQIALKPQWVFFKEVPIINTDFSGKAIFPNIALGIYVYTSNGEYIDNTGPSFDIGSNVTCWTKVIDETSEKTINFANTYVNIHSGKDLRTYLSGNSHQLGFNGTDSKSRAIVYQVTFNNGRGGKGHAASLNNKTKTGIIILYSEKDLKVWEQLIKDNSSSPISEVLKKAPLICNSNTLQKIFGLV